jgi:ribonuclease HI
MLSSVNIKYYTDGSCNNAAPFPRIGGWAYIKAYNGKVVDVDSGSVYSDVVTSNRMELKAIIEALVNFLEGKFNKATIYSDSKYAVSALKNNAFSIYMWELANWKTSTGDDVKNIDMLIELSKLIEDIRKAGKKVYIKWVKAHNNIKYNEYADKLANKERLTEYRRASNKGLSQSDFLL